MSKTITTRIQFKHDRAEFWDDPLCNVIALPGEFIIYEADPDNGQLTARAKIGNGKDYVRDLPFVAANIGASSETVTFDCGDAFNLIENNISYIGTTWYFREATAGEVIDFVGGANNPDTMDIETYQITGLEFTTSVPLGYPQIDGPFTIIQIDGNATRGDISIMGKIGNGSSTSRVIGSARSFGSITYMDYEGQEMIIKSITLTAEPSGEGLRFLNTFLTRN